MTHPFTTQGRAYAARALEAETSIPADAPGLYRTAADFLGAGARETPGPDGDAIAAEAAAARTRAQELDPQ